MDLDWEDVEGASKLDFVHSGGISQRLHESFEQRRGDFNDIGFPPSTLYTQAA